MKRLLITGFDPFCGHRVNPSWEAVRQLPEKIGSFQLYKLNIPTVFGKAAQAVLTLAQELDADAVICVGLAGGRNAVTPERIAVNIRDARIADNEGNFYSGLRVDPAGPAAYFSTLPVDEMAAAIRSAGIPAGVSNSAGTYVCNDVLYTLLHCFPGKAGFIHVPQTPDMGEPSLPLSTIVKALEAAIGALETE